METTPTKDQKNPTTPKNGKPDKRQGIERSSSKKTAKKPKRLARPSKTVEISGQLNLKSFLELKAKGRVSSFPNSTNIPGLVNRTIGSEPAPTLLKNNKGGKTIEAKKFSEHNCNTAAGREKTMKGGI